MPNWNKYLANYQLRHGGHFFGAREDECDSHLVLTEGEPSPILVWVDTDPAGRYSERNLKARTMVRLNKEYNLHIWARSLVGTGVKGVLNLVKGEGDYGYPEATRGRAITTSNEAFTKLVLGDLELRNALIAREKEYLKVRSAPQGDGWHVVEVGYDSFEGTMTGSSPWMDRLITNAQELGYMEPQDRAVIEQAAQDYFDGQMDEFLIFLRAARRAVTTWRL